MEGGRADDHESHPHRVFGNQAPPECLFQAIASLLAKDSRLLGEDYRSWTTEPKCFTQGYII